MLRILIGFTLLFVIAGCGGSSNSAGPASQPLPDSNSVSSQIGQSDQSGTNANESWSDLNQRFENAIKNYIRESWGAWAKGDAMGKCFIANAETMTKESKQGVIEYGIEEAFNKLTGDPLASLSETWNLCESAADSGPVSSENGPSKNAESQASDPTLGPVVDFVSTTGHKSFSAELETQFQDAVDQRFDKYTEKAGITAAVYTNGYLWRYAKGDASSSEPMTVGTPTLIRSSSKSFTAGLVLKQIDDGLYSLSDPIDTILSDSAVYEALNKSVINPKVTIEELLNMTSGFQLREEYGEDEEYNSAFNAVQIGLNWEPVDLLQLATVSFKTPGNYEYSNTNTMLLGVIAEHAAGKNLNALYKTELFDPLGIVALLLPRDLAPENTARPHGEGWDGTGFGDLLKKSHLRNEWFMATGRTTWNAAGVITTPENLARWAYELFSPDGSALSQDAQVTLLESFAGPLIQIGALDQQYGYHSTKRAINLSNMTISAYGHPGSGGGYTSIFYYSPELDLGLSIQVNSHTTARTQEEAQGAVTHAELNEMAWQIFDAYARR